jgi:hypothetical protein
MNKTQILWGILSLLIAAVLAILILVLPPGNIMFQIGDRNMPWVPVVALGIIGVILLATAREKQEMPAQVDPQGVPSPGEPARPAKDPQKTALNKRLESVAWGLFLIMLGGFALVPNQTIPQGVWSIGVGLIMLGLNAARYYYKLKMSGFTTVLGILSLLGGIAGLIGMTSLNGAFLLIILGAYLILKPWFEKRQLFGKAEEP